MQKSTSQQIAHELTFHHKGRMSRFRDLPLSERAAVFNVLSRRIRQEILKELSVTEAVSLLDHLDVRRAHHILGRLHPDRKRERIVKRLKNDLHAKIEQFTQFHPRANASLVHLNYVLLSENTTIGETAAVIKDYTNATGKIPEVFVSREGEMIGEAPLDILVRERNTAKLKQYARGVKTILYTASKNDITNLATSRMHAKTAVLDTDKSVLGVVYADDISDILDKTPASSLYSFAGVQEAERPFDSIASKIRHRYKWLILNLGTAFLAAGVVALFNTTLSQVVMLAIYMPIIAGMGGNAATQTLAVMVRGIAVGEISLANSFPAVAREVASGLANGVITGVLVAAAAFAFGHTPLLGLVVGLTLVVNLMVAGCAGTLVPVIMRRIGRDPATSATIFITTATDVCGFFVLLGLASLVLL
ncbi:MAG: magnesium transporter [bacterium]|nr:magnesium transporter [bacterium]